MILTRHFVYLHVPKTGGNFVRRVLTEHAPASWQLEQLDAHADYRQIPASHAALPRLAFTRNPFDWYVSWFHFQQQVRDPFFLEISDGGQLDFAATMRRAFADGGPLANSSGGLTQTLLTMLGTGLEGVRVGRIEQLRDELPAMIRSCTEVPAAMQRAIDELPPQNTSRRDHYSSYYDDELRQLVEERERPVLEHFGYRFEPAPPSDAAP